MRILNVGSNYRIEGGSDRYLFGLASLLEKHGHEVIPFAARHPENRETEWSRFFPPGMDPERPTAGGLARFLYNGEARRAMSALLETTRPDLAHLHVYYGQLTASILQPLRQRGIPVLHTLHDYKLGCPVRIFVTGGEVCEACEGRHFWQALPRRCNRGSFARTVFSVMEAYVSRLAGDVQGITHFISPSSFLRDKMIEHDLVPPKRISVVPNFVDPGDFEPARGPGEYFVYAGRLRREKGVATLLDAVAGYREAPLLILGEGPEGQRLETQARESGSDHVRFLGFTAGEALREAIRRSIAVVVPSEWYENCPMIVLEAMAMGRPVIGSDMGGIPELIRDGVDGWLFPAGQPEALRERLLWAATHREEAASMGARARKRVEARYDPETHYERVMGVYEALASPTARP